VLINDIFGGHRYPLLDEPLWEHDWQGGLRMLQMGMHTHLITCRVPATGRGQGRRCDVRVPGVAGLLMQHQDSHSRTSCPLLANG
jgi:hypothetical protein